MENQQYVEEEIDLRKYIEIIIKRRKLILSLFCLALVSAALILSLAPKVYKATASVTITPAQETLLTSKDVLQRVIKKLNLPQDPESLLQKLSINKTAGTSGVILSVTDANPEVANDIANAWAEDVTSQVPQRISSAELDMKKALLNNYKSELAGIGLAIKSAEDTLAELKKQIAAQEKIIVLSREIADEASGSGTKSVKSEAVNPVYQDLSLRIVNAEIEINSKKRRAQRLNEAIVLMAKEIQAEEFRVVLPAISPKNPEGQGKMKIVVLAGILSLMFGVFSAFFMEFWEKIKKSF